MSGIPEIYAARRERYEMQLLALRGTPYVWGGEMPDGADCSGSVCLAISLALMTPVRLTAQELYERYFTSHDNGIKKDDIRALFVFAAADMQHGSRSARRGECIHVAGCVSPKVILNCEPPAAHLERLDSAIKKYTDAGHTTAVLSLDQEKLLSDARRGCVCRNPDRGYREYILGYINADTPCA